jgi:nitric oxide reductase subunit C
MTTATTRRFFFVGTFVFAAAFVLLTVHTHTTIAARTHADRLTDSVRRGERVWEKYNCENCHTLLGEGAYYAPDLTQIVAQRGAPYLTLFMADPSQFYTEARDGRLMPTLGLSAQEITDVIAFLDWIGHIDTNGWPPRPILVAGVAARGLPGVSGVADAADARIRGKAVFDGAGACASCHAVAPGVTLVGPSLASVATRAREWLADPSYKGTATNVDSYLRESIVAPGAFIVPGGRYSTPEGVSIMPDHYAKTLQPQQVDDLVAYLQTLR